MSDDGITVLPDGSACTTATLPLPKNHWIYGDPAMEHHFEDGSSFEPPPMPFRMGTENAQRAQMADMLRMAAKYALRVSTGCGTDSHFDPDAVVQNLVVGFLGYYTPSGLSDEDWGSPVPPVNEQE